MESFTRILDGLDPDVRIDAPALDVLAVVGAVMLDWTNDPTASAGLALAVYRRLTDRGLVCRQLAPAPAPAGGAAGRRVSPSPDGSTHPRTPNP